METVIYKKKDLEKIKKDIKEGSVIAFPTDTVFGLGVTATNEVALNRLKKAKLRDAHKPIPMMVSSIEQIKTLAIVNDRSYRLIKAFMPGAFTIVLKKKETTPAYISNGLDTIAIRMPDDEFVLSLLDEPMLVTSANLSGEPPGRDEQEVLAQLNGRIDGVVEGVSKADMASTIVDMSTSEVKILREGIIKEVDIKKILKEDIR